MNISLRTTSYTAAVFVALILGFLLLLGSRQYRSHKEYENIIEQNEKIIFQFSTIREHINESLLENRLQQLNNITHEIESLNANISQILQQPIIPDEYRLSFAGQVDFAGIILLLRNIGTGDQSQANKRQLNQEIRILGERLMLFDRVIVDHVKRKLVGFQNFVIGLLAIVLFIVVYILLFWHRQIAVPLIDLVKQAKEVTAGKRSGISLGKKSGEVAELAGSFQNILIQQNRTSSEFARYNRVLDLVHKVSQTIWHAQTRDAVFNEACRGILTNSDYVLAWIGIPDQDNQILPVIADASTTMSRQERDECMTALLIAAEENRENYDAAHKALAKQAPEIVRDILQGLPKGPFKNTPFATNKADCIALPLVYDQQVFGVINIYSIAPLSFTDEEIELLKGMSREIVFALFALDARESNKALIRLQSARKKIFEYNTDLILILKGDGSIFEVNPAAKKSLRRGSGEIIGTNIYDMFRPASKVSEHFLDRLKEGRENIILELTCQGVDYMANISCLKNQPDEDDMYLFIARDLSEQKAHKKETIKASKLAAMGELSVGVANEINNLTNGLINYTQILSEEIDETGGENSVSLELLNNVIQEGERISQIVQQLLFFNATHPRGKEAVKINKIIEDAFSLTKHQFRYDAIEVSIKFPTTVPSVQVNVQEMQHVFLNLLSNARYALNQRYPGQHPQKRLEIKGEVIAGDGQHCLKITCTDFGVGIHPNIINKVFEPFFSTKPEGVGTGLGLSISKGLVEDNNGTLAIESILDDHTTLVMEFPVTS
jgi:nitrogen-specific signal transduction histidine kinase/HAMP domain-containing protein